jgi:hypothetical protein
MTVAVLSQTYSPRAVSETARAAIAYGRVCSWSVSVQSAAMFGEP